LKISLFFNIGFFWQRLPDFFGFSKFRFLGITCEIFHCFSKWGFLGSDFPMIGVSDFPLVRYQKFSVFQNDKFLVEVSAGVRLFPFCKIRFSGNG